MKSIRRLLALALTAALCLSSAVAAEASGPDAALADGLRYILAATPAPAPGSVGGEWAVFALARGGAETPKGYYGGYRNRLVEKLRANGGILHQKKYTEYARAVLALTAIGKDPADVGGYDLLAPLGDYDQVTQQGVMGPIMALLALDCGEYEMPQAPEGRTQAGRESYVDYILARQTEDGGFALTKGGTGDVDVTSMALQVLAKYQDEEEVSEAVDRGLDFLSAQQGEDGGYGSWGTVNAESAAQVLVALCELEIDPEDERFVKNGHTVVDGLLAFYLPGQGFSHTLGGPVNAIATEQGTYALAALARFRAGEPSLYRITEGGASKPQETAKPEETPKSQETVKPEETPKSQETPKPTPTPTPVPTYTSMPTPTPAPIPTPTPTLIPTPTPQVTLMPTPQPSLQPTPTPQPVPVKGEFSQMLCPVRWPERASEVLTRLIQRLAPKKG